MCYAIAARVVEDRVSLFLLAKRGYDVVAGAQECQERLAACPP